MLLICLKIAISPLHLGPWTFTLTEGVRNLTGGNHCLNNTDCWDLPINRLKELDSESSCTFQIVTPRKKDKNQLFKQKIRYRIVNNYFVWKYSGVFFCFFFVISFLNFYHKKAKCQLMKRNPNTSPAAPSPRLPFLCVDKVRCWPSWLFSFNENWENMSTACESNVIPESINHISLLHKKILQSKMWTSQRFYMMHLDLKQPSGCDGALLTCGIEEKKTWLLFWTSSAPPGWELGHG